MPLLRYFVVVGGALLALLLISDAALPRQPLPAFFSAASSDVPPFRIRSDQKWPERIVFDTRAPVASPAKTEAVASTGSLSEAAAQEGGVRDAFARMAPAARWSMAKTGANDTPVASKAREIRPQGKRKVTNARPAIRLAQSRPALASTW